jgi:hypothetical protein
MQKTELHNHTEQKATNREDPAEEILQVRQKTHFAQGGKIVKSTDSWFVAADSLSSSSGNVLQSKRYKTNMEER